MTEEVKLGVEIDADVNGSADAKSLADAVADISSALKDLVSTAKSAASQLDRVEKGASGASKGTKAAAQNVQNLAQSYKDASAEATAYARAHREALDKQYFQTSKGASEYARAKGEEVALKGALQVRKQIVEEARRERLEAEAAAKASREAAQAALKNGPYQTGTYPGSAREVAARFEKSGLFAQQDELAKQEQRMKLAALATDRYRDSLFTARFALHDLSNMLAITGGALVAFNAFTIKTAADYEQAFAQIQRTTGATSAQMQQVRSDFIGLAQSIPVAFSELGKIGTLAGQLNIPTEGLSAFTETVAKFASTTDVGVEAAATAFGRLDTLLPDVQGNYEALGSSILNVGVNSVATESEIISTTNQIAAAGAQAGFAADQVIGLAASFASLGVAPEAARGTTIRVLSEIRTAVLQGGDALQTFADLTNQSAEAFKNSWNSDAAGAFMTVLEGLNKQGATAEVTLRSLGITAVRDIRALLALSQNVEVVGNNMSYAADGFNEATQLGESFNITANTLASRLQVLGQSLEALIATLGESGTGPLRDFVNFLNSVVVAITELAKNPLAQWGFVAAGIFTALTGGALLLASAFARLGAGAIAIRTVRDELKLLQAQMLITSGGMQTLQSRAVGATLSLTTMRGALTALASTTAVGLALTAITVAATSVGDALKSNADKAKEAYGDFTALSEAIKKDTEAARAGATVYAEIEGSVSRAGTETAAWVRDVEAATGSQVNLADGVETSTEAISKQTFALGENARAALASMVANNELFQKATEQLAEASKSGRYTQFNTKGFVTALVERDTQQAQQILDKWKDVNFKAASATSDFVGQNNILSAANSLQKVLEQTDGAVTAATTKMQVMQAVSDATGVSMTTLAGDLDATSDAATTAADSMQAVTDAVSAAFAGQNAIAGFADAFYQLASSIATGGASMSAFTQEGQANLANLQTAIATSIAAGETMGVSATDSVAALFLQLQKMGVDTANLLASLANVGIPGVSIGGVSAYLSGTRQMTGAGLSLSNVLDQINTSATAAAQSIGGGGGGGGGVGGAAEDAAQKIRTLVDYANDLGSVFDRSFDLRFGNQQALDKISEGWNNIAESTKKAKQEIADAQAKLKELSADKAIQEYFLGVAKQYGDTLRAGEISAKLADINKGIADEQERLSNAQGNASKTLTGNSKAAIENRQTILGMVSSYQDYLTQLAESGASQAELERQSTILRQEFIRQATQMGFNGTQVLKYADAFKDFTQIIKQVPRNITVSANINPAKQALNEFVARTKDAMSKARGAVGGGVRVPVSFTPPDTSGLRSALIEQYNFYKGQRDAAYAANNGNANGKTTAMQNAMNQIQAALNRLGGWKEGGYTGNGAVNNVAGVVHGREFVIDAANTRRLGLPFLNALNSGKTPAAPATSNIMVVELSAYDRKLLAAAGNVNLTIGAGQVAAATNASNLVSANRGSN